MLKVPVSFSLIASGLSYFIFVDVSSPADLVIERMFARAVDFPLLAIPFFIIAGSVMNYAGISSRLMDFAEVLTGHLKGGLAQVNVLLSTMMGGITGSASADAAMQCKMLVPEMVKRGYTPEFSAAVTASSAIIPNVIPPGIGLIIYAFLADVSVARMFFAGYLPGLLMCVFLMITISIIANKRGYEATREKRATIGEIGKQLKKSIPSLFLPFGIILGLRFGLFTATEAGAMSVLYAVIIGFFVHKELKISHFSEILKDSVKATGSVLFIIIGAAALSYYLSWERIPQQVTELVARITTSPMMFLFIVNIFLLILGMFLDSGASMIILVPLLVPTVMALGIDPIHFGIMYIVNINIGTQTPPFGNLVFLTSSILKLSPTKVFKEVIPLTIGHLLVLAIVTYLPQIVLFFPNLLLGV